MDREAENHIRFVSLNLVHCRLMKMRQGKQNIVWEWNFAAWLYFTTYLFDKNYVNTSEAKIFYYYMHKITAKILHGDKQLLHNDNRDENYLKISQQLLHISHYKQMIPYMNLKISYTISRLNTNFNGELSTLTEMLISWNQICIWACLIKYKLMPSNKLKVNGR